MPRRIWMTSAAVDGAEPVLSGSPPVTARVMAMMPIRVSSQPRTKPSALRVPRRELRTRMNAVRGRGSSAIARPMRMRSIVVAAS
jgi:hypothetical protein